METKQALKLLEAWQESYMSNAELCSGIKAIFGDDTETEFYNTISQGFERHTDALAVALGDSWAFLLWYLYENDMGGKQLGARPPGGTFRKITNLKQLLKLIEESRDV